MQEDERIPWPLHQNTLHQRTTQWGRLHNLGLTCILQWWARIALLHQQLRWHIHNQGLQHSQRQHLKDWASKLKQIGEARRYCHFENMCSIGLCFSSPQPFAPLSHNLVYYLGSQKGMGHHLLPLISPTFPTFSIIFPSTPKRDWMHCMPSTQ